MSVITYEAIVKNGSVQLKEGVTLPKNAEVIVVFKDTDETDVSFEEFLNQIPNVGTDNDFARIPGQIRSVELSD
ncbi:MAG: hypothetical protein CMJ78_11920 [Planctomycetaceae bacterium]|nr:hypothetical protein [Planctomycetaceae bacterium]